MSTSTRKELSATEVQKMFLHLGERIKQEKDMLGQIDSEIGDGDHGSGMYAGAQAFTTKLKENDYDSVPEIFKVTGMEMMKSMGGASGVIFGTMFSGGVKEMEPKPNMNIDTLATIFMASTQAVKKRGKAEIGDKTMIDALEPGAKALQQASEEQLSLYEGLVKAEEAAKNGVEFTKDIPAKFGRAKTLGERAMGYQDAGATSVWLIIKSMREWIEQNE